MTPDDAKHNRDNAGEVCGREHPPGQDEFVEVAPHVRLHIRDWGRGKTIVFVHGWALCNEVFEDQFARLTRHFRCLAPSLRGFGRSSQPWGTYDLDVFADDLRALLEARCLRDIVLVGFGMGGAVALRYMARHSGYRVSKLAFLAAAAPVWTKRADFPQGGPEPTDVENMVTLCSTDRARLVAEIVGKFCRSDTASSPRLADWLFQLGMQASPHAAATSLRTLGHADLRSDMDSVKVATLVLHGKQDKLVPFAIGEVLAHGIYGAEFVAVEESGHALFWEAGDRVSAELARFAG